MRVLVVVDMQNDFVDGALGSREAVEIVPRVVDKISTFEGECLATLDTHTDSYLDTAEGKQLPVPHCIEGTAGWALNEAVSDALVRRHGKNGCSMQFKKPTFGSVALADSLCALNRADTLTEIVLVGVCTDICVISNALLLKAFLPEVKITVDASCCAGVTPESHQNALMAMKQCQINIENWE